MLKSSFKLEHPLEWRQAEAYQRRKMRPDRISVILEKAESSDIPDIDRKIYPVRADSTVGQFVCFVRKMIKLSAEKAIFVFVKNAQPPTAALMSAIYKENKDEDGFLYMTYSDGANEVNEIVGEERKAYQEINKLRDYERVLLDVKLLTSPEILNQLESRGRLDEEKVDSHCSAEISKSLRYTGVTLAHATKSNEQYKKLSKKYRFYRIYSHLQSKKLKQFKANERKSELLLIELKSKVEKLKWELARSKEERGGLPCSDTGGTRKFLTHFELAAATKHANVEAAVAIQGKVDDGSLEVMDDCAA